MSRRRTVGRDGDADSNRAKDRGLASPETAPKRAQSRREGVGLWNPAREVEGNRMHLTENERAALAEIKRRVRRLFDVREFILFGSKARGDAVPDSDIDLMIITGRALRHRERHAISHELFEVNLQYDTQFSFVTVDADTWDSERYGYMPLRVNVAREGVSV